MHKVWAVIRREFVERVRSKWFLVSTVLGPLFMIAVTVLPSLLMMRGGRSQRIVMEKSQAQIVLGHLGVRRKNPDYLALKVMDTILGEGVGGGFTARIPYQVRDIQVFHQHLPEVRPRLGQHRVLQIGAELGIQFAVGVRCRNQTQFQPLAKKVLDEAL